MYIGLEAPRWESASLSQAETFCKCFTYAVQSICPFSSPALVCRAFLTTTEGQGQYPTSRVICLAWDLARFVLHTECSVDFCLLLSMQYPRAPARS